VTLVDISCRVKVAHVKGVETEKAFVIYKAKDTISNNSLVILVGSSERVRLKGMPGYLVRPKLQNDFSQWDFLARIEEEYGAIRGTCRYHRVFNWIAAHRLDCIMTTIVSSKWRVPKSMSIKRDAHDEKSKLTD
jgi:hypothetical protein